jgi:hypothetical protein
VQRPQFPFCDTGGTLGGAVNECIAVNCTPGAFAECRGDTSVVCDATGENYELQQCVRGCDDATGGCHIDPSNDLGQYYDMVPDPPDLELVTGTIDTYTGTINGESSIPNFLVPAPSGGAPIRVFVARRVRLVDVTVVSSRLPAPALAIITTEDLAVEGSLTISNSSAVPGGLSDDDCRGKDGAYGVAGPNKTYSSGQGGGGHGTAGGAGGSVSTGGSTADAIGGAGGSASGTAELVPLRGGCSAAVGAKGQGGGATQLASMTTVRVVGGIDVGGQAGSHTSRDIATYSGYVVSGGGAGGGVLLEAPNVILGPSARVLAKGGAGASRENDGSADISSQYPNIGASCSLEKCGAGGNGASADIEAEPGQSITHDLVAPIATAGGGGGGLGRLRINSADGTYMKAATTIEAAVVTSGVVTRR